MIDFHSFHCLPRDTRAELVWQHGAFLTMRDERGCRMALYHMGAFFAEVWYSHTDNRILTIRGTRGRSCLEPYLERIDLEALMREEQ